PPPADPRHGPNGPPERAPEPADPIVRSNRPPQPAPPPGFAIRRSSVRTARPWPPEFHGLAGITCPAPVRDRDPTAHVDRRPPRTSIAKRDGCSVPDVSWS